MRRLLAFLFACGEYGIVQHPDVALMVLVGPCMRRWRHRGRHSWAALFDTGEDADA